MSDEKNILEFMGEDHDRLDKTFEEFRKIRVNNIAQAALLFHEFKTGLLRHIVWEEEILFPIFEEKTGMHDSGPTAVMRMEHRKIQEFLESINNKIGNGDGDIESLEISLIGVLTEHNIKEEKILYPWIDQEASDQDKKEAFTKMKNLSGE